MKIRKPNHTPVAFTLPSEPSTTAGIQEAIDALPSKGGRVFLSAGRYMLRRSVRLRSNVILEGAGAGTVITRPPLAYWPLAKTIRKGETHLTLKQARGLRLGDEILIGSLHEHGWCCRHGVVKEIRKQRVDLELLDCPKDTSYLVNDFPIVANWFPALSALEADQFTIKNLTIQGPAKKHKRVKTDFTVAGIHTRRCTNVRVLNVNVTDWTGDGIGIQGGESAMVRGCIVDNCCGQGLHPGTGLTNSSWVDNIARNNTVDGYFFCRGVRNAVCKGNLLYGNKRDGIGGLGYPDEFNVVSDNISAFNGQHGLNASEASGNTIQGNIFRNNSQEKAGAYPAVLLEKHRDNMVVNNLCIDDQEKHTQRVGIQESAPAGPNVVSNNACILTTRPAIKKKRSKRSGK